MARHTLHPSSIRLTVSPDAFEIALDRCGENYDVCFAFEPSPGDAPRIGVYGTVTPLFVYRLAEVIAAEQMIEPELTLAEVDEVPAPKLDDVLDILEVLSVEQATTETPGDVITHWRNLTRS